MQIFFLRHGDAKMQADSDSLRPLSTVGRKEVKRIISENADTLNCVECVWVSPYLRAQQTYKIASEFLPQVEKQDTELLVPGAFYKALIDAIAALQTTSNIQSLLCVTHQPLVGAVVDQLCGFEPGKYRMGTSALAAIETEIVAVGCAELRWLRQPY